MAEPATIERGSMWRVKFPEAMGYEQGGSRPAMVISANAMNQGRLGLVVIAIMTTKLSKYPSHVLAAAAVTGADIDGSVMCKHIRTVSVTRLGEKIGQADASILAQVDARVRRILAL
jgi:mRNA interferase MazF